MNNVLEHLEKPVEAFDSLIKAFGKYSIAISAETKPMEKNEIITIPGIIKT